MSKTATAFSILLAVGAFLIVRVETACYDELGCFPVSSPWTSLLRPFPAPQTPREIDVHLYLWTRSRHVRQNVTLWPNISLSETDFDPKRPKTVFISHGFFNDGNNGWIARLAAAYLEKIDANVFIVDWGKGSKQLNYLQVASNIRIVGAEVARFGKYLEAKGLNISDIHLIGHSLGAHISSYIAKRLAGSSKVGRITALDPAQPGFEGTPKTVRLTPEDAEFIDVLHTDARPFTPLLGFGMLQPVGHVDFYVNGGSMQPGCLTTHARLINTINDLLYIPMETLQHLVSCSHLRAYDLFIAALSNECAIWGRALSPLESSIMHNTIGTVALPELKIFGIDVCRQESCSVIGLRTPEFKARGNILAYTSATFPYCEKHLGFEDLLLTTKKVSALTRDVVYNVGNLFRFD